MRSVGISPKYYIKLTKQACNFRRLIEKLPTGWILFKDSNHNNHLVAAVHPFTCSICSLGWPFGGVQCVCFILCLLDSVTSHITVHLPDMLNKAQSNLIFQCSCSNMSLLVPITRHSVLQLLVNTSTVVASRVCKSMCKHA